MKVPRASETAPANLFGAASVDPTQFRDLWNGTARSPERDLAVAMLDSAAMDLRGYYRYSHLRSRQRVYWQAYQWVASPDREWPFSFVNICETLNLSPDALAGRLLGPRYGDEAKAQAA